MKKRSGTLGKILGGLALVAILVLAVSGVLGSYLNKQQTTVQEPFRFESYSDCQFACVGDGLLAVSQVSIELFDPAGQRLCQLNRSFPEALMSVSGNAAVIWCAGGGSACVLHADGNTADVALRGALLAADVNRSGWSVFLTEEAGYKGAATVYRPDGTAVYKVYLGTSYPLDADVSPSCADAALLTMVGDGCQVALYSLSAEIPQAEWSSPDMFLDLEYLSDDRILLLSTDRVVILDKKGNTVGTYAFRDEYLKDYAVDGDGFVTLVLGRYRTGNAGRLLTLDLAGNLLASLDTAAEVAGLSVAGKYVLVQYNDQTVVYDSELTKLGSLEHTAGTQATLMRTDGSAIILSGMRAAIYEP